jgi:hypothetical protein
MKKGRRAGFSGMRVFVSCDDGAASVEMVLRDGNAITDDDRVRVVANDYLATGGDAVLTPAMPAGGFDYPYDSRLTRDLLVAWFKKRGGSLRAGDFSSETARRWNFSESFVSQCQDGV